MNGLHGKAARRLVDMVYDSVRVDVLARTSSENLTAMMKDWDYPNKLNDALNDLVQVE